MGIEDINAILKEHVPEAIQIMRLKQIHGYAMAVDAAGWFNARSSVAHAHAVMKMVDPLQDLDRSEVIRDTLIATTQFLRHFTENGVTVVWVWDGKSAPEKSGTLEKRRLAREQIETRIAEAKSRLLEMHPLARNQQELHKYKSLLRQRNRLSKEEMAYYRGFVEALGWPSLEAPGEGEKLAAMLAREGWVAGVWSTDTDTYALGTPMVITGNEGADEDRYPLIKVVFTPIILAKLGWTQAKFLDFCIALGCDYNSRMPNVGPKRVWDLFQRYNSLEEIERSEPNRPIHHLKYPRCRQLFAPEPSGVTEMKTLTFNAAQFIQYARDIFQQYGLDNVQELAEVIKYLPPPKRVTFT